jgi:hypothetical protein
MIVLAVSSYDVRSWDPFAKVQVPAVVSCLHGVRSQNAATFRNIRMASRYFSLIQHPYFTLPTRVLHVAESRSRKAQFSGTGHLFLFAEGL